MNAYSKLIEILQAIGRSYKAEAAINQLQAEEDELAGDKYLSVAARLGAAEDSDNLELLYGEISALSADCATRSERIVALLARTKAALAPCQQ